MRTCPDCDQEIEEEIDTCPECGAALVPAEGVTVWACPKCKQEVTSDYEVCWACGTTIEGVEDPGFFDERSGRKTQQSEGETPESLVTVAKCSLPGEAHAIRMRLEAENIPVFLFDEFTITMDWLLSNAIGGIKVQVPDHALDRAREILGIMEEEEEEAKEEQEEEESLPDGDDEEMDDDEMDEDGDDDTEEMGDADEPPPEQNITEKAP
jgi:RNA polymerase subunit RPABC4/transcription elongation factor Spt4